ncbi:hypothetical protein AB0M78_34295, partial [Streptomyces sp. NPDC051162]
MPGTFHVLLGPGYAGKSSALSRFAAPGSGIQVVSVDDAFLGPEHHLLGKLRRALVTDVVPGLGRHYSPDFMATLLQTAVVHLRDRVLESSPAAPVLVDSYYYKVLALASPFRLGDEAPLRGNRRVADAISVLGHGGDP